MDDSRTTASRATRKVFVITNPDKSDSDSEDDGARKRGPYRPQAPSGPQLQHLTTHMPRRPSHAGSIATQSPPSSISSPIDTTTPPSTPGTSSELTDIPRSHADRQDQSTNGASRHPASARPAPEIPALVLPSAPPGLMVMVTADSDQFYSLDVTGCSDAAIREKMFSRLHIHDEDQPHYSIYKTEIGQFAIGDACKPNEIAELCRNNGDTKGTLKFLVTHSSAQVHEIRATPPARTFNANTIPPVLPMPFHRGPHSTRSRNDSVSSVGDRFPRPAPSVEYDASGSEGMEDESHRATMKPLPKSIAGSLPSQTGFPSSPHFSPQPDIQRPTSPVESVLSPRDESSRARNERQQRHAPPPNYPLPPPPPLEDSGHEGWRHGSDISNHARTASDNKSERAPAMPRPQAPSRRPDVNQHSPLPDGGYYASRRHEPAKSSPMNQYSRRPLGSMPDWTISGQALVRNQEMSPRERPRQSPNATRIGKGHDIHGSPIHRNQPFQLPPAPSMPPPTPPAAEPKGRSGMKVPSSFFNLKNAKSYGDLRGNSSIPSELRPGRQPGRAGGTAGDLEGVQTFTQVRPLPPRDSRSGRGQTPTSSQFITGRDVMRPSPTPSESSATIMPPTNYGSNQRHGYPAESNMNYGSGPYSSRTSASQSNLSLSNRTAQTYRPYPEARLGKHTFSPTSPPRSPNNPHFVRPLGRDILSGNTLSGVSDIASRPIPDDTADSTIRPEDQVALQRMLELSQGGGTIIQGSKGPAAKPLPLAPAPNGRGPSVPDISQVPVELRQYYPGAHPDSDDDDDDSGDGTLWKVNPTERPLLSPIRTEHTSSSTARPPPSPHRRDYAGTKTITPGEQPFDGKKDFMRPPPEQVYDRLDEYFKHHDLDKPVIEASSGGTSPTTPEPPSMPIPQSAQHEGFRHKKSIRAVAADHKRRINFRNSTATDMRHKRSTKLWGSKLEEVTSGTAHSILSVNSMNAPESPTTAPKPIFKWVRGEMIGRGTYGRVYLALNATTGEMIAVKQVEIPQTASDREDQRQVTVVEALKSESETLKDLDHPHIVQYLGFEETPKFLSIFLEYVPGGSVGSCIRKHGKFSDNVCRSFTAQIVDGLEYLHSKGILHRDLKADNILVENTGICKISDFGISKRTDENNAEAFTAMQGTVFWMAPEVVKAGKKGYTSKIDIWSVGCVILEMWAGRRPWNDEEMYGVMLKLYTANAVPPVPDDIQLSPSAEDFRLKCFALNPDERPTASALRLHPYLEVPAFWQFNGDFKNS